MLTADQIEALGNKAQQLIAPVTEFLIEDIARRIAEAGQFTSTSAYQTWRLQQLGISQRQLKKELRKRLKVSHRELRRLIEKAGETGYSYDIRKHPYVQAVPFRSNEALQQIVSAAAQLADSELDNITQTMGAVMPNGKAVGLQTLTDRLAISPYEGFDGGAGLCLRHPGGYRNLAENGIVTVDYESGVHTSMEAAVRRSVRAAWD